jgi:Flp pilus assembly pilin Flp
MLQIIRIGLEVFGGDRRAVTALEYALVAAGIAAAVLLAFGLLGTDLSGQIGVIASDL